MSFQIAAREVARSAKTTPKLDIGTNLTAYRALCCMELAKRTLAPTRDQLRDTDTGANGLPEITHSIERFDRNCNLGGAAGVIA
jgi:hypothetical protein